MPIGTIGRMLWSLFVVDRVDIFTLEKVNIHSANTLEFTFTASRTNLVCHLLYHMMHAATETLQDIVH